jgi:short-subunit dehydrogenase
MAGYCASKAGVNALLDALRVELQPYGIVVTTICPGWVRTSLTADIDVPQKEMMDLGAAARRILESIRRRKAFDAFPPADKWRVRLLRHVPLPVSDWLTRQVLRRYARK